MTGDLVVDAPDRPRATVPLGVTVALTAVWIGWIVLLGLGTRQRVVGLPNDLAEPVQHLVGFFVLGALAALLLRWPPTAVVAAVIALGFVGELAQLTTDDRSFGLGDLTFDAIGAVLGVGAVAIFRQHRSIQVGAHVLAVGVLAASPWVLANSEPQTSFPERCFPAPAAVGVAPTMILDVPGLPSADFPVVLDGAATRDIRRAVVRTNEFTLEAWFETTNLDQGGPPRIFTISGSASRFQANLHLGIHRDNLVFRLRTACELVNEVVLDGVVVAGRTHQLVATWSAGELAIWLDGAVAVREPLAWGDFKQWNASFRAAVGDEAGGGRRFDGTVHAIRMWDVALPADEIADLWQVGPSAP